MEITFRISCELKVWTHTDGRIAVRFDGATELFDDPDTAETAIEKYLEPTHGPARAALAGAILVSEATL